MSDFGNTDLSDTTSFAFVYEKTDKFNFTFLLVSKELFFLHYCNRGLIYFVNGKKSCLGTVTVIWYTEKIFERSDKPKK